MKRLSSTKTDYVIVVRKTGQPLGYEVSANEEGDFCGDYTVELNPFSKRVWSGTLEEASKTLFFPCEWYNSGFSYPMLRDVDPKDLMICKREVTTRFLEKDVKPPLILAKAVLDTRSIPINVARMVLGEDPQGEYNKKKLVLVQIKKGCLAEEDLQKNIGKDVFFDPYFSRKLIGYARAREEYADEADFELVMESA